MTPKKKSPADKQKERQYHRTNGRWQQAVLRQMMPLGRLLMQTRDSGRTVRLEDPRIKPELTRLIGRLTGWHSDYSRWRREQGRPLTGQYRPRDSDAPPETRAVAAAKETAYRLKLKEKARARAALRDLAEAAEELAQLAERRKTGIQKRAEDKNGLHP